MSERTTTSGTTDSTTTGATRTAGGTAPGPVKTDTGPITVVTKPAPATTVRDQPDATGSGEPVDRPDEGPGGHPTEQIAVRPKLRGPRRGPLTRMGPWAPVAGALVGLLAGVVVVLLLAGAAADFADRLALVLAVVGLGMLGAAGTLLGDEVRMIRQSARDAAVRAPWAEATRPLLSGVTPARLLLLVSVFVLFLAAYVTR